ncbi:MAG TPA: SPFH domain-containing protein [Kofleriaceae bacterium]
MIDLNDLLLDAAALPAALIVACIAFKALTIANPEGHELLQLRFGVLRRRRTAPGLAAGTRLVDRWLTVSRQWDERIYKGIETNDSQGTSVQIDLRVTFRIADSERALFAVEDWEQALESACVHEAGAVLAGVARVRFLRSDAALSEALSASMRAAMASYGLEVLEVRLINVQFRLEVARQMFEAVAAKLEVAKAEYEERGKIEAALLLARTEQQVAGLEALAKTESLKAVGRAYQVLRRTPDIYQAYTDLYQLSQIDPTRVVSFDGFAHGELSRGALVESDLELDNALPAT